MEAKLSWKEFSFLAEEPLVKLIGVANLQSHCESSKISALVPQEQQIRMNERSKCEVKICNEGKNMT